MIGAIAFDWGGIFTEGTFDSDAVRNLARLCAVPEESVAKTYFPLMAHFEAGEFDMAEFVTRFRKESGLYFDEERFRETFLSSGRERTQMYDLLAGIPDAYRVGMLSNNVPLLCDRVRSDPRMARVETFLFSNELGVRKPDPAAYRKLQEALELPPSQIVFIDDSEVNVSACRRLGFAGIHFRSFDGLLGELNRLAPDICPKVDG
ncbi:MAG TPA: HAD family phosphatase [Trueperaceae bacterium]